MTELSHLATLSDLMGAATPRRIRVIAPSGYVESTECLERALARLREAGHTVEGDQALTRIHQRFAGTDAQRQADLTQLYEGAGPLPEIVLSLRGGYGAVRLLEQFDYAAFQRRVDDKPIALVGFSDFTALQLALLARTGQVTFAGPMLSSHFGQETVSAFTMTHFWQLLSAREYTVHGRSPDQPQVDVSGTLWGGNLAVLSSLVGTPYVPAIDGGILFVEDIHEQPFRTERMLYQLYLAGILQRQKALVMGAFSESTAVQYNNGYTLDSVVAQMAELAGIPIVRGLPFGHIDDIVTLPVGAHAHLRAGADGFSLTMSAYPNFANFANFAPQ